MTVGNFLLLLRVMAVLVATVEKISDLTGFFFLMRVRYQITESKTRPKSNREKLEDKHAQ